MAQGRITESELSNGTIAPSAPPPRFDGSSASGSPPGYDAVLANDPEARRMATEFRSRGFTESLAHAGASVGRFFGIHDDELQGWNRAGTLPPNRRALGYNVIAQSDNSVPVLITPPDSPPQQSPTPQRRRRFGRLRDTLGGRRRDPTREEVMKTLPKFWPVMTILIALVEIGLLIATIITGGLAPIKIAPETITETIVGFNNESTLTTKEIVPNFFIGTSKAVLVHTGAMYAPCIRENVEFQVQAAKDRVEENNLRCCLSDPHKECGMLPQQTCVNFYGQVLGGASRCRSEMNMTDVCLGGVTLHPCCVGLLGQCIVTTEQNCTFQDGYWHPDKVLCSEVGTECFNDICEFSWIRKTIGEVPSQGMRFFSAMFLYDGVITLVIIGVFKLYNSWTVERRIGWLRVVCIYTLSGIGGFMLSGLFDPTSVSVGGTGGLFGLLGVSLVEVLQGWKWVRRPCIELIKILVLVVILLFLGTLPYIDNFTQIGGFVFGVLASFIFVPYITIGKWDRLKKLCLLSITIPIILALFLFGFVLFYNLPNPNFCPHCSYINCIPYTSTFCEDFIGNILPFIPSISSTVDKWTL